MAYLIEVPVGETSVMMSVRDVDEGLVPAARPGRLAGRAAQSLDDLLARLRPVAESFVRQFDESPHAPDELNVQFGITLSAEADLVIATTATEANFTVSMTWNRSPIEPAP